MTERFRFGANWLNYLASVGNEHVLEATDRLSELVGDIRGKTFLDIGCGSGIHSLAAVRLGASRVYSFDYDLESVQCSTELRKRFAPNSLWSIQSGSALDEDYLRSLEKFDVVYSWGVLHHTGDMWRALELATIPAKETLALCLYKDQGVVSRAWQWLKRLYVEHPRSRPAVTFASLATIWGPKVLLQPHRVVRDWHNWKRKRGMSPWHDIVDWAGGYPFEFAKASDVIRFYKDRGFELKLVRPFGRIIQMHEFVFLAAGSR